MLFRCRPYKGSSSIPAHAPRRPFSVSSSTTDRLTLGRGALTEKMVKNSPPPIMAAEVLSPCVKHPPLDSILNKLDAFHIGLLTYLLSP